MTSFWADKTYYELTLYFDVWNKEILGYVMMLFPMLSDLKIQTQQIPADGTYKMASVKGMSVLIPDLKKNRDVLASIMQG